MRGMNCFGSALPSKMPTTVLLEERVRVHAALPICDRGYVLSHGELVAAGSADSLDRDRAVLASSYLGPQALDDAPT